jgi:hypothetical protein
VDERRKKRKIMQRLKDTLWPPKPLQTWCSKGGKWQISENWIEPGSPSPQASRLPVEPLQITWCTVL